MSYDTLNKLLENQPYDQYLAKRPSLPALKVIANALGAKPLESKGLRAGKMLFIPGMSQQQLYDTVKAKLEEWQAQGIIDAPKVESDLISFRTLSVGGGITLNTHTIIHLQQSALDLFTQLVGDTTATAVVRFV